MNLRAPSAAEIKRHRPSIIASAVVLLSLLVLYTVWLAPVAAEKEAVEAQLKQQTELSQKYQDKLNQTQTIRDNLEKQRVELEGMQKKLFHGNDPYQLAASLSEALSSKEGQKLDIKTY